MATYDVTAPDGTEYEIEAENDDKANEAMQHLMGQHKDTYKSPMTAEESFDFERGPNYPESGATDPTISDAMNLTGGASLLKGGASLLGKAAMTGLGKVLPTNIVKSVGESADEQLIKSLGGRVPATTTPQQLEDLKGAARAGRKAGLGDVFSTQAGRREGLSNHVAQEGKTIGELRKAGGAADSDALEQVAKDPAMRNYYREGLESKGLPAVNDALGTAKGVIEDAGGVPTHESIAKAATKLNRLGTKNKMYQSDAPMTDVANSLSGKNNADLVQKLGPEKGLEYTKALENESDLFKLEKLVNKGDVREMNQKGGFAGSLINPIKESTTHRALSKGLNSAYEGMNTPVDIAGRAKGLLPAGAKTVGGVTASIMNALNTNPQSLGKYAAPLSKAAQKNGNNGIAATHFILSQQDPDYSRLMNGDETESQ